MMDNNALNTLFNSISNMNYAMNRFVDTVCSRQQPSMPTNVPYQARSRRDLGCCNMNTGYGVPNPQRPVSVPVQYSPYPGMTSSSYGHGYTTSGYGDMYGSPYGTYLGGYGRW